MAKRSSAKNEMQDPALPQKQQARWRFIGATILALFAVVLLPLALESEPRQSMANVDVSIPNREDLGRQTAYWPDTSFKKTVAAPAGAERPGLFTRQEMPAVDANRFNPGGAPAARAVVPVDAQADKRPDAVTKTSAEAPAARQAPEVLAKAAPPKASVPKPPPMPERRTNPNKLEAASPSGYVVQIGAFSSGKGARAQVKRARELGFKAYTQRIKTKKGDRIRVRVGPYLDRTQANKAREKLRAKGIDTALIAP